MSKKIKENLTSALLVFLYESKKMLTSFSIQQYLLHDYYHLLKEKNKTKRECLNKKRKIQKTISRLRIAGYLRVDQHKQVSLSYKGLYKAILYQSQSIKSNNKPKRSNTFYLIVFDIPERYRHIRNLFRKVLYNLGAQLLQKSVFIIYGQQSYMFIKDLVKRSEISEYVKIITGSKIE